MRRFVLPFIAALALPPLIYATWAFWHLVLPAPELTVGGWLLGVSLPITAVLAFAYVVRALSNVRAPGVAVIAGMTSGFGMLFIP